MQKSMRYYIVKTEDQPVVRSVAVARQEAARLPVAVGTEPAAGAVPVGRPGRPLSGVARLMRSAMRRNVRGADRD